MIPESNGHTLLVDCTVWNWLSRGQWQVALVATDGVIAVLHTFKVSLVHIAHDTASVRTALEYLEAERLS